MSRGMRVGVFGEGLEDYTSALKDAGADVVRLPEDTAGGKNSTDALEEFDSLLVDWNAISDDGGSLLHGATLARRGVTVVFDEVTPFTFHDVILRWTSVDLALDRTDSDSFDPALILGGDRQDVGDAAAFAGLEIGSAFRSRGGDYEEQRFLSLVSPGMRAFISELRMAINQMRRRPTDHGDLIRIPWDASNSQSPKYAEGRWKTGTPNLSDVIAGHATAKGQELLRNGPGVDPRAGTEWGSLPQPLLLLGESGTGKSLVADLVHRQLVGAIDEAGPAGPFVKVNCAGLRVDNLDHELFGSAEGWWTGIGAVAGLLTQAAHGLAFLDEIGDLPSVTQSRMLGFLDDLMMRPTGIRPFFGFVHIVAATNKDLDSRVELGHFRNDLLARFTSRVTLPPLRRRCSPSELRRLIDFVAQNPAYNGPDSDLEANRAVTSISLDAMRTLMHHEYRDGNFRELEEIVAGGIRNARLSRSSTIEADHIEVRSTRHRPDIEERTVRVRHLDLGQVARTLTVTSEAELRRLAELTGQPILEEEGTARLAVLDGTTVYVTEPDS